MTESFPSATPAARHCYVLGVISWVLLAATFWSVPQGVWPDVAWQVKASQQYIAGESATPNHLTMPDNGDLSRDSPLWMGWWSPGTNLLISPLLSLGIAAGNAVRLLAIFSLLVGSLGWIRYAGLFCMPKPAAAILSLGIPWFHYAAKNLFSYSAEALLFASVPWVLVLAHETALQHLAISGGLYEGRKLCNHALRCFLLGLSAGALFILKYSGLYISLSVAAFFAIISVRSFLFKADAVSGAVSARRLRLSALPVVALFGGIVIPVLGLSILNWRLTRFLNPVIHTRTLDFDVNYVLFAITNPLVIVGNLVSLSQLGTAWVANGLAWPISSAHLWWPGLQSGVFLAAALAAPGTVGLILSLYWELPKWCPRQLLAASVFLVSAGCALITWTVSSLVSLEPRHVAAAGLAIIPFSIEAFYTASQNRRSRNKLIMALYSAVPLYALAGLLASVIFVAGVRAEFRDHAAMGSSAMFNVLRREENIGVDLGLITDGFNRATDVWYVPEPSVALDLPGRAIITLLHRSWDAYMASHRTEAYCSSRDLRMRVLVPKSSAGQVREAILNSFPQVRDWSFAASGKSDYELWLGHLESGGERGWRECQQKGVLPHYGVR